MPTSHSGMCGSICLPICQVHQVPSPIWPGASWCRFSHGNAIRSHCSVRRGAPLTDFRPQKWVVCQCGMDGKRGLGWVLLTRQAPHPRFVRCNAQAGIRSLGGATDEFLSLRFATRAHANKIISFPREDRDAFLAICNELICVRGIDHGGVKVDGGSCCRKGLMFTFWASRLLGKTKIDWGC
jgi:hypothetical protein